MSLQDKYREVINLATEVGIANLQVREQDNVLYMMVRLNRLLIKKNFGLRTKKLILNTDRQML